MYKLSSGARGAQGDSPDDVGLMFGYTDPSVTGYNLPVSESAQITDPDTALGRTISQLYGDSSGELG